MEHINDNDTELDKTFREWEKSEKEYINYMNEMKKMKNKWFQFIIISFLNLMYYLLKISLDNLNIKMINIPKDNPHYSIEDID